MFSCAQTEAAKNIGSLFRTKYIRCIALGVLPTSKVVWVSAVLSINLADLLGNRCSFKLVQRSWFVICVFLVLYLKVRYLWTSCFGKLSTSWLRRFFWSFLQMSTSLATIRLLPSTKIPLTIAISFVWTALSYSQFFFRGKSCVVICPPRLAEKLKIPTNFTVNKETLGTFVARHVTYFLQNCSVFERWPRRS